MNLKKIFWLVLTIFAVNVGFSLSVNAVSTNYLLPLDPFDIKAANNDCTIEDLGISWSDFGIKSDLSESQRSIIASFNQVTDNPNSAWLVAASHSNDESASKSVYGYIIVFTHDSDLLSMNYDYDSLSGGRRAPYKITANSLRSDGSKAQFFEINVVAVKRDNNCVLEAISTRSTSVNVGQTTMPLVVSGHNGLYVQVFINNFSTTYPVGFTGFVPPEVYIPVIKWRPVFDYTLGGFNLKYAFNQRVLANMPPRFYFIHSICPIDSSNACIGESQNFQVDRFDVFDYAFSSQGRYKIVSKTYISIPYILPPDIKLLDSELILDVDGRDYFGQSSAGQSHPGDQDNSIFAPLLRIFRFNFLNPFATIFKLFTPARCVNIPIIAGMLNSNQIQYCSWFGDNVRNVLTPVFGFASMMLIFGFFIRWLSGTSGDFSIFPYSRLNGGLPGQTSDKGFKFGGRK